MELREVGRWRCEKCGKVCVAAGPRDDATRIGIVVGAACPWDCGFRSNRGFRFVRSTDVTLHTVEAWDQLAISGLSATFQPRMAESRTRRRRNESAPKEMTPPARGPLVQHLLAIGQSLAHELFPSR